MYISAYLFFFSLQSALSIGVFSVSPCVGVLQPGSLQVVTVYCTAEQLGLWNQGLLIDISDRDPLDHADGIPYRLMAEVCKPSKALNTSVLSLYIRVTHTFARFCLSQVSWQTRPPFLKSITCAVAARSSPLSPSAAQNVCTSRRRANFFSKECRWDTLSRPTSNCPTTARCRARSSWLSDMLALR